MEKDLIKLNKHRKEVNQMSENNKWEMGTDQEAILESERLLLSLIHI